MMFSGNTVRGLAVLARRRRWRNLLRSLTLDPDQLARPVAPPPAGDFLICGSPRSGTALLTAMLFQPPQVVTVMEPWDGLRLPPADLFASLRAEIRSGTVRRGRLDVGELRSAGAVRWCSEGQLPYPVDVTPDFRLGVKFPAFWRYLDLLPDTKFLVCLRDPVEVVHSYATTGGRLREGFDYDVPFNARMNDFLAAATDDVRHRRVLLHDYITERILPHLDRPNVLAVRYERWFHDRDGLLSEIAGFLGVPLASAPARIEPPRASRRDDAEAAVRAWCTTAAALGYPERVGA